ncbi:restriction endonuclease subunit S [Lactococcus sp. EKM203L]|jgi:type I restriction enzyme S subunit|nr:restriction endonuclease subunit S [Enterococcus faecalis]KAF6605419.1 restriction endonuclease subunit S [Lactococcus sp. EKM201L]KAF6610782.1 restriction endonuclease subunit S [Lactococcus sp. EKM203L]KAF6639813.1 restriction endonuclease subunit S [Lactococcus sp. EKM501L]KAF6640940.1 restriction endonuclease subunit S [Lactococcus sp. EKM502L]KAF6650464.1 restriction endonuclease subunit S [Lactococcus sp. EKM101L]KAF6666366.1 restriction endonuclease subunit S [Lactococcus sp. EKM102
MVGTMAKIDDSIKKKVPELRFKGFTDDWEQRKLTEIVNRVNKSSNSDVLPKVEFEDIVSGEGRLNKDISSKFDSRKGTLFEPENILYGKLRPYLKNWLFSDFEGVALGDFWVFEATDVSVPSFDYYLIQSDNYQKVANDTSGTKMPRSDWKNVSSTDFAIPSKDEQKQIGAFFKQLDNTIVLHQRRLDLLKEQKKGYLQKMFPKNGAKVPELRFAGFADDWEERKFKDILKTHSFRSYLADGSDDGKYEVIQQGNNPIVGYSDGEPFTDYKDITLFGDHTVSLYNPQSPFFIATDGVKILSADNFEGDYLYTTLERYKPAPQGYKRHFTILKNKDLCFTRNVEEQKQIGSFFKQLDNTITLHQRKLDLLKEQKKGFLQKMFV